MRVETIDRSVNWPTLDLFWRSRRRFLAVFGAVLGLAIIALVVLPVYYRATASVVVAKEEPGITEQFAWIEKVGDSADLESQLQIILAPPMLHLALAAPGVSDAIMQECRDRYAGALAVLVGSDSERCNKLKSDSDMLLEYVQRRYIVASVGRSRVINISYQSTLPQVAETMANALASAFLNNQRTRAGDSREPAITWLSKELNILDADIHSSEASIQEFRQAKGLLRGANAAISAERLTSMNQQLVFAEADRAEAAARLREIRTAQGRGSMDAPWVLTSRAIIDLKQQLTLVSMQLASATEALGPKHPAKRALESERTSIEGRILGEVERIAASAEKTYNESSQVVDSLRVELNKAKADVAAMMFDEASMERMTRDLEVKRARYTELFKRVNELEAEGRVAIGNTRIVSLAELPIEPFFPKRLPFLVTGLALALLLASLSVLLGDGRGQRWRF